MYTGLKDLEVKEKLAKFGYNELPGSPAKNLWKIIWELVREPMLILLISCGVLYFILGDQTEGAILLSSIFVIIGITFFQHRKTEHALDALKKLSSPRVVVIRSGKEIRIPGRELVPGDIFILNEGDRISADAKILESNQLTLDESVLTGESIGVNKSNTENLLFSGTLVLSGKGIGEVIKTGVHAEIGQIAGSLSGLEEGNTRLQQELKRLFKILGIISVLICIAVIALFYLSRGNIYQSILNGLAASMALLPEEFPVVLTIFLALGAWRLSSKNVLTRKPAVIETLGSATVLCSDKTGTITKNVMSIAAIFNGNEIFYRDQFTLNEDNIVPIVSHAALASDKTAFDPMEKAVFALSEELASMHNTPFTLIKEYPLNQQLSMMTRVFEHPETKEILITAKGAPESILTHCKINEEDRTLITSALDKLASSGFRVIAVATAKSKSELPESQDAFQLDLLGLIAMQDPIRDEVPKAIEQCKEAGIRVIMITGDYPVTAVSIGKQCGLLTDEVLTGDEIETMEEQELMERIKKVEIIARVKPAHKLRIVNALKANGEVVAMTGDGVNDAPALKAADIGIAMGNKGTDVAREASSLVLLDDNFSSIVEAIRAGRKIFDNLQKAMSYILAIHIPIIGLTLFPAFISTVPILLMPLHIVFLEMIIDPICSIAFESEKEEQGIMKKPPRDKKVKFFGKSAILISLFQGLLILGSVLLLYMISVREGHSDEQIRTICFTSLILGNIFLIMTKLSKTRSFLSIFMEPNKPAIAILFVAAFVLGLITLVPDLQVLFSFSFPGYAHYLPALIAAGSILVLLESIKLINKHFQGSSMKM